MIIAVVKREVILALSLTPVTPQNFASSANHIFLSRLTVGLLKPSIKVPAPLPPRYTPTNDDLCGVSAKSTLSEACV